MTTRVIPERKETNCDVCGTLTDKKNRAVNGALIVKADALDFQGMAVADASVHRDLCDKCLEVLRAAINATAKRLAAGEVEVLGKYTPGPWIVTEARTSCGRCYSVHPDDEKYDTHGGACLYDDDSSLNPHSHGEQEANAHLMSAAPAMYEHIAKLAEMGDAESEIMIRSIDSMRPADSGMEA